MSNIQIKGMVLPVTASPSLAADAMPLLRELLKAHGLIFNMLNLLSPEQKQELYAINERQRLDGEGLTRANERERLLLKHCGRAKP